MPSNAYRVIAWEPSILSRFKMFFRLSLNLDPNWEWNNNKTNVIYGVDP